MSCKRVTECVAARVFYNASLTYSRFYSLLQNALVNMMPSLLAGLFVYPAVFLGEEPLPFEFLLPEGYFESRALGMLTAPNPSSKSFWRIFLTSSICFFRFAVTDYMCLIQDAFPGSFF